MTGLKRTPLYHAHLRAGAKLVEFGGWEMPVQYTGIIKEHELVRHGAGLFDVSHMGEIEVTGAGSLALVQQVITNDAAKLSVGQALYSPMCYPDGGTVDDLLVYKLTDDRYLLVVNAGNIEKDYDWIVAQNTFGAKVENISARTAQLALQGPRAATVLQRLTAVNLAAIKYFRFVAGPVSGVDCIISRTGYTGEDGLELYFDARYGEKLWDDILQAGKPEGVGPVGLGARDTLRFEAALPLYGHELTETASPVMAGLHWTVKFTKDGFTGREALLGEKEQGTSHKLVGLEMVDRGIPRPGYTVTGGGQEIGWVTSGTFAPSLNKNLALAYVTEPWTPLGTEVHILVRGKALKALVVAKPFYQREAK